MRHGSTKLEEWKKVKSDRSKWSKNDLGYIYQINGCEEQLKKKKKKKERKEK
jgi:hypothetical protein